MENIYEISLLLDFYGQLLTTRQYEVLDLYYNNDYSLGEISEYLKISRQGVHDNLKRGIALLNKYEKKMHLLAKYLKQKENVLLLLKLVDEIDITNMSVSNKDKIMRIKEIIVSLSIDC